MDSIIFGQRFEDRTNRRVSNKFMMADEYIDYVKCINTVNTESVKYPKILWAMKHIDELVADLLSRQFDVEKFELPNIE